MRRPPRETTPPWQGRHLTPPRRRRPRWSRDPSALEGQVGVATIPWVSPWIFTTVDPDRDLMLTKKKSSKGASSFPTLQSFATLDHLMSFLTAATWNFFKGRCSTSTKTIKLCFPLSFYFIFLFLSVFHLRTGFVEENFLSLTKNVRPLAPTDACVQRDVSACVCFSLSDSGNLYGWENDDINLLLTSTWTFVSTCGHAAPACESGDTGADRTTEIYTKYRIAWVNPNTKVSNK